MSEDIGSQVLQKLEALGELVAQVDLIKNELQRHQATIDRVQSTVNRYETEVRGARTPPRRRGQPPVTATVPTSPSTLRNNLATNAGVWREVPVREGVLMFLPANGNYVPRPNFVHPARMPMASPERRAYNAYLQGENLTATQFMMVLKIITDGNSIRVGVSRDVTSGGRLRDVLQDIISTFLEETGLDPL